MRNATRIRNSTPLAWDSPYTLARKTNAPTPRTNSTTRRTVGQFTLAAVVGMMFVLQVNPALARHEKGLSRSAHQFSLHPLPRLSSDELGRLPHSDLDLVVTGIVIAAQGQALISVEGKPDQPFVVGETIASGVVLVAVHRGGAVIRHDGGLSRLELKGRTHLAEPGRIDRLPIPTPNQPPIFLISIKHPIPEGAVKHQGNSSYVIERRLVKEQLDSPDLLSHARLTPLADGGYRLIEIVPGSLYEHLGFRDGDVIRTINGKAITSVLDLADLYGRRSAIETLQIEIVRRGNQESMEYRFR